MSTNRYGVDVRYFREKLLQLVRDVENYRPEELARALKSLSETAAPIESLHWRVRFQLDDETFSFTDVKRKARPISLEEVREWAEAQVRVHGHYRAVDEIYIPEDNG